MTNKLRMMALFAAMLSYCTSFAALVDIDGNPATNETYLADIDQAEGTLGDLKNEIAPNYEIVANAATNAVANTINTIAEDQQMVELMSQYGIVSSVSNELMQMSFSGNLLTNKCTISYDNGWKWTIYSSDTEDVFAIGEIDDFSPFEHNTTIELTEAAAAVYGTPSITFTTSYSSKSASGVVRDKDLTTMAYDNETDWMTVYFKNGVARNFPNSNQVERIAANAAEAAKPRNVSELTNDVGYVDKSVTNGLASASSIPTNVSQLENDSGFATTGQVTTAVSNLEFKIALDSNIVRRTDGNFSIGNGNSLGIFSAVIGNNNTLGGKSSVFGFNNSLLSPSQGNAQQYAFGFGNRSQAQNNFIAGIGSGATDEGESSITLGAMAVSTNAGSFVWNWYPTDYSSVEADQIFDIFPKYYSHGSGSFNINPIGGLKGFWIGDTNFEQHVYNTIAEPIREVASNLVDYVDEAEDAIMDNVTNKVYAGHGWPYGGWTYTPEQLALTLPVYTNSLWRYTETNEYGEIVGTARWIESPDGYEAVELTDTLNGTNVVFTRASEDVYTNKLGLATTDNLKQYVKHTQLEQTLNGYVTDEELAGYDASYGLVEGVSTQNQTIQFVMNTDASPSPLQVALPSSGRCKDWIIYVFSSADMQIVLPPASYWIKDESVTNSIAGGVPTALYFSQVSAEGVYTIGRQEYTTPITINPPLGAPTKTDVMRSIMLEKKKSKTTIAK